MTWRAAKSLLKWHAQLKAGAPRAAPPATDPNAWGLRAGATHAQSGGHFPHHVDGLGDELVTAADAPNAPRLGLDIHAELDAIRRSRDPRVLYAISNDQMFSSYAAHGFPPYTWRPYNPTDPSRDKHIEHGHLQVVDDARADGEQPWATATPAEPEDDMANTWTQPLTQGTAGYAGQQRDTALAFAWKASSDAAAGVARLESAAAADEIRDKAVLAAITAIGVVTGADLSPVITAVNAVRDEARLRFAELAAVNADLTAEVEQLRAARHAAAQVEADATAGQA